MAVHGARALLMLTTNKRASRLVLHLGLAVFEPAAARRGIEVIGDTLKVRHSMQSTTMSARSKATIAINP